MTYPGSSYRFVVLGMDWAEKDLQKGFLGIFGNRHTSDVWDLAHEVAHATAYLNGIENWHPTGEDFAESIGGIVDGGGDCPDVVPFD
jgi:hypothetical protein